MLLTPAEASHLIGEHLACLPIESLPVGQCAGAILRENVYAERDQPPFDRVAMDGIAVDAAQVRAGRRSFRIQATQAAGDPPLTLASADSCVEIMTGAMLPQGCDAVVPVGRHGRTRNRALEGERIAPGAPISFNVPLAGFIPVRVETDDWGRPWAMAQAINGPGDFAALAGTDGFVELPPGPNDYPKGFVTRLYRW